MSKVGGGGGGIVLLQGIIRGNCPCGKSPALIVLRRISRGLVLCE